MNYYVILPRSMDGGAEIVGEANTYEAAVALVDQRCADAKGWYVREQFNITQVMPRLPAASKDRSVLRTVYLPADLDETLRMLAFRANMSRNDVMVAAIRTALEGLADGSLRVNGRGKIVKGRPAKAPEAEQQRKDRG